MPTIEFSKTEINKIQFTKEGQVDYFDTETAWLGLPPGNRLEALSANREGQHSIRINDQWRICFRWIDGDAYDVEIVDYH